VSNRSRLLLLSGPGGTATGAFAAATARALVDEGHAPRLIEVDAVRVPGDALASVLRSSVGRIMAGLGSDPVDDEDWAALPGVAPLSALYEVLTALADPGVDVVVVDCGGIDRARELMAAPSRLVRLLDAALTPRLAMWRMPGEGESAPTVFEGLSSLRSDLLRMDRALGHGDTIARLITTPDDTAVAETLDALTAMPLLGVAVDGVAVTGAADPPRALVEASGEVTCWAAGDAVLPAPQGLLAIGPLSPTAPLTAEAMVLTSLETGFTLDVPLSGPGRARARVGRRGDDLVVAAAGVTRALPLPPVLRRCHAVEAMRSERGLCVRFTPDAALWREPDASVA
jgi:arsenite-transporting ATPase